MNWFKKWIAKSAIDSIADKAKKMATVANVSSIAADGVTRLMTEIGSDSLSDEKRAKICAAVKNVSEICAALADTLKDGKVTTEEVADVITLVTNACAVSPVTDAMLGDLVDKVAKALKEKL